MSQPTFLASGEVQHLADLYEIAPDDLERVRKNGDVAGLVQKPGIDRESLLARICDEVSVHARGAAPKA